MLNTKFISQNSRFFENLMEHRFVFDICQYMVVQAQPRLVNVLKSDVDAFGFDLALSVSSRTAHLQMKTRVGKTKQYLISEHLWRLPNAYVIWINYGIRCIEPQSYSLLDLSRCDMTQFTKAKRYGYRKVGFQKATHSLDIPELVKILFP